MDNPKRNLLIGLLHEMELHLKPAAIEELIRLVGSSHFKELTPEHIRNVAQYQTIEIEGECYFERAFSPGKETSSSLDLARMIGREEALADLIDLHASIIEPTESPAI
ncbi:MAG: hypothetical protein ACI8W3_000474 [Myxococcota bacterium]|jgi:hypothetical protein